MSFDSDRLVGRDVYARDDMKVGTVKRVSEDGEYAIIDRDLASDLFVPMDELRESAGRLVVPRTRSFLDDAPDVGSDEPLSIVDRDRLERFYRPRAA